MVDTNVLFTGMSRRGPEGAIIDAWVARRFTPCVSTALALEYEDVLIRKLGTVKQQTAMKALQALLSRCEFVPIRFTHRPASPDPGDDLVIDCVLNSRSLLVTSNVRDFRKAAREWDFMFCKPPEFLDLLQQETES